jgi:hypothetical protein
MTQRIEVPIEPKTLALFFWNMDSAEQAQFFAELEKIAGYKLCLQMAHVVDAIVTLADAGERDAQNGFQTMLAHAQDYVSRATEIRHSRAQRAGDQLRVEFRSRLVADEKLTNPEAVRI